MKPRLLDLFCGAGGAGMGYHRAGFEVVGVDIKPQPHYPFKFVQGEALEYVREHGAEFDVIHASPPCQAYSTTKGLHSRFHPMLIDEVRLGLSLTNRPFVIENVKGAPLLNAITLCGSSFGLGVWRHRLFESPVFFWASPCQHDLCPLPLDVTGTGGPCATRPTPGGGLHRKPRNLADARWAMGIDWMTRKELAQAIPPAYTAFIGSQLMSALKAKEEAA
jgi:DNA (cytosine-5)-methyltransferase 1